MDPIFAGTTTGRAALAGYLKTTLDAVGEGVRARGGPIPAGEPDALARAWAAGFGALLPETGAGPDHALTEIVTRLAEGAADPADPACAAHLHCPPLAVAVAADTAVSALNPSLDSWDQAPAASALEDRLVAALAGLTGYDAGTAGGAVTTGGTESNLMGLLLARDRIVRAITGAEVSRTGIPAELTGKLRILCSSVAHFSVARSAGLLGLGEDAVLPVAVDEADRMRPDALCVELMRVRERGEVPLAVVATAGTTDLGAIDPLGAIAELTYAHRVWFHVDAAYGGGALFSDRLAPLLAGIGRSDSVGLDLHKLGWQPVAAGVFLSRDRAGFRTLDRTVAYLNPADDEAAGYRSRLGLSLRTTRRADAAKIAVTLRAFGRRGLGALVDRCHDLARYAAAEIGADPGLELRAEPTLSTVVFRFLPPAGTDPDQANARLRRALLASGTAVVGRTTMPDRSGRPATYLKLTLLNPTTTQADIDKLLLDIRAEAELSR
ncbi:pyridoxal phosphate-dependent decarboxylase family protein [Amycolatopsis sp. CA-230715]|uniref:pyridoxal phosphate-dependent decarboxylase family protein n=1 Tax=Amycolatopsis sp. CA-230715 TaxID=2745196 RepID=UPI001C01C35E|nr:pyridoxal-dependent decarboxylase [Amycolatopsis sp. CA-230715]QWF76691.1 L-2,4-diaminobutyrate decarboxylase [Amycolatopsis sp. CA-230715]